MLCAGLQNPFFNPPVEKNRVWHGKNINFTRVDVTLALLGLPALHSQTDFFFHVAQYTIFYLRVIKWILLPRMGWQNPFFNPPVDKNRVEHRKNINYTRVVVTLAFLEHPTSHSQNYFFSLVAQYTIFY